MPRDFQPLAVTLADRLAERITTGALAAGERLPSERALCAEYAVSRATLRLALDDLEARGLITRHQGRGTFVQAARADADLGSYFSIGKALQAQGKDLRSHVLAVDVVEAARQVATDLAVLPGDPLVRLRRLRSVDDEPLYLETTFMAHDRFPELEVADFNRRRLYAILDDDYGCRVETAAAVLEPVVLTPEESTLLEVTRHMPALFLRRVTKDCSGQPVEVSEALLRGDRARFVQQLSVSHTSSPMQFAPVFQ